jgi:hypothetical protein
VPSIFRSILAVLAGILSVVVLSEGTDAVLRSAGVFPPLNDQGAYTDEMLAAATVYRTLASVVGGYVTAALAPANPMRHAVILGAIGLALSIAGVVANEMNHLGPTWYPIALAVTAFPSVWIGGRLRSASTRAVQS